MAVTLPDVNVLIEAFRPETARHQLCRGWLDSVVNGSGVFGMAPQVMCSFIRIVTHQQVFQIVDPLEKSLAFCSAIVNQPHCQIVQPGPRHWAIFHDLCIAGRVRGNLVQNAWLAALAIEAGCEWLTLDRDYARFPGLRWREP